MSFLTKLRSLKPLTQTPYRLFSTTSILNPDSKSPLTSLEKSRAALSLLRFEKNPERILEICRAASLTPESHLDRTAYSTAITKLKSSNYFDGIRSFISDSLTRPDLQSDRFISHFIILYGQAGLIKDALKLFDEMPQLNCQRSTKSLNALLMSCVLASEYGEMKRVFSDFPKKYGLVPDVDTYNNVLKGFCESGSSDSAHSVLAEMGRNGVKPNAATLSIVVAGFYKEEKFDDVTKMLDSMKRNGVKTGVSVLNVRIKSLCKLKKSDEAKGLLDEAMGRKMKPTWVTYNNLIYGFCREGKFDVAKSLYRDMVGMKLKPESDFYFTFVHYLCKGKDFETALGVCKESMEKGWVPNITTMKTLVDGLVNCGKVDEAKDIIGVVKEKFSRNADKWVEIEEGLAKVE